MNENFEATSRAPPNLDREKANLRSSIRNEIDSNFEFNQCVWGPYWVRFEAANSNKWYGVLVYDNGKGVYRALGGFGGMAQNPRLFDISTTRDQKSAIAAAVRKLKSKERKGYSNYSAESFEADSPFNTLLLIRQEIVIEDEDDFNHLLQIYLELEQDIAGLYADGNAKHHLLPEMMGYRNEIAARLDEIQEDVEIEDTIEMDAEFLKKRNARNRRIKGLEPYIGPVSKEMMDDTDHWEYESRKERIIRSSKKHEQEDLDSLHREQNIVKGVAGSIVALVAIKMWTNRK
jgi:predicted DNA-binding WGR domain protein